MVVIKKKFLCPINSNLLHYKSMSYLIKYSPTLIVLSCFYVKFQWVTVGTSLHIIEKNVSGLGLISTNSNTGLEH